MQEHCFIIGRSQHMHEDFGTIINKGFNSWVRNLNICIPFILGFFVSMILYALFFGLLGVLFFSSSAGSIGDPTNLSDTELISMVTEGFMENLGLSVILIVGFLLFGMYIQSFFTAGAVGMAKKAVEAGDTVFTDMLISGSKNSSRFFLTNLLISLILLGGIIFIVPGALKIGDFSGLLENPEAQLPGMGLLLIGIIVWSLYVIIINILFSLAPYALVIDGLDPLEALKAGFNFFKENKVEVFLIWVIFIGFSFINTYIGEFIGSGSPVIAGFTYLVPVVLLQPLAAVLWTRLYMSRKGKKLYDPSDLLSIPDEV